MTWHSILAVASGVALAAGSLLTAQQRFKSGVDAVRVDVLVTRGNRLVSGLTADDFELRDSGVIQRIEQIEVERLPLNVMLVLDTSGSVAGLRLSSLLSAGRALVSGLRPGDRAALVSFGSRVRLLAPLTRNWTTVLKAFDELYGDGATPLRDASFAGLALREADPGRSLMLLFTDGADTASWISAPKVIETARRTDVVIYPVRIRDEPGMGGPIGTAAEREVAKKFLEELATTSGGRVMTAGRAPDLRDTFIATLAEFRERYVLSYEPRDVPPAGWHPLDVALKGRRGDVTARRGYFVQ